MGRYLGFAGAGLTFVNDAASEYGKAYIASLLI